MNSRSLLNAPVVVRILGVALAGALALAVAGCGDGNDGGYNTPEPTEPTETTTPTPDGGATETPGAGTEGASLVQERCTTCHGIERIEAEDGDRAKWTQIVDAMIARGAQLNDSEREVVISYLAEQYPDK